MSSIAINAVIFDWGGTLTPWHAIDLPALWRDVCVRHFSAAQATLIAEAVARAESEMWMQAETEHRSATLAEVLARAGVSPGPDFLDSYFRAWDPHTYTDPDVAPLLRGLRERGIRIGVLSNTMWPRSAHERVFRRDQVLTLIDGAVYTSEIPWTKPHPEAFRAAMTAIGATDPASCVFVGDRPYDDIYGAKQAGMRAVLMPHSEVPPHAGAVADAVISRLGELPAHLDGWWRAGRRGDLPAVTARSPTPTSVDRRPLPVSLCPASTYRALRPLSRPNCAVWATGTRGKSPGPAPRRGRAFR